MRHEDDTLNHSVVLHRSLPSLYTPGYPSLLVPYVLDAVLDLCAANSVLCSAGRTKLLRLPKILVTQSTQTCAQYERCQHKKKSVSVTSSSRCWAA
jgi:hypothetical protein